MHEPRLRRSTVSGTRERGARRAGGSADRPPASPATDEAALLFLSDILIGDRDWTLAEVRRLISLRDAARRGRRRAAGSDGTSTA
jgi:hypothetical protein